MKNPLVVGYKGEIGSFILGGLLKVMPKALDIWCVDINESAEDVIERIDRADVIFLCVPFRLTAKWIEDYNSYLKSKVIVEQCSLKEWIYDYNRIYHLDIRSMHVLFRPSQTPNLVDREVGLIKGQFSNSMISAIGKITDSNIVMYGSISEHDREMALQQALLHRSILILGSMLSECKGKTYMSKRVLELYNSISSGNSTMYRSIQNNLYLPEKLQEFEEHLKDFEINNYL